MQTSDARPAVDFYTSAGEQTGRRLLDESPLAMGWTVDERLLLVYESVLAVFDALPILLSPDVRLHLRNGGGGVGWWCSNGTILVHNIFGKKVDEIKTQKVCRNDRMCPGPAEHHCSS